MIRIIQGFNLLTRDAVDNRIVLTKQQMREINDNQMPDNYFAICKDDGLLYLYDKAREVPPVPADGEAEGTGKFKAYAPNAIGSVTINGEVIPITDGKLDMPLASKDAYGVVKAGIGLKADNGVFTIDFNEIEDTSIPLSKIDFSNIIIDAND